jgi:beta-glucanase (GH16 family)
MSGQVPGEFAACSLAWAEEFDGPAGAPASPQTWRPETGGHGWGNSELQYYTGGTANAALDGAGHLALTVRRPDPPLAAAQYAGCQYTSARLTSKNLKSFRYGLIQAKIKLPSGRGIWPPDSRPRISRITSAGIRRGDQPEMSMYTLVLCSARSS